MHRIVELIFLSLLVAACAPSVTVDRAAVAGAQAQYAAADTATAAAVSAAEARAQASATQAAASVAAQYAAQREELALAQARAELRATEQQQSAMATQLHAAMIGTATALPLAVTATQIAIERERSYSITMSIVDNVFAAILICITLAVFGAMIWVWRAQFADVALRKARARAVEVIPLPLNQPVALLNHATGEWEINRPEPPTPSAVVSTTAPLGAAENYRRNWAVAISMFAEWWRRLPKAEQGRRPMESPPDGSPMIVSQAAWNVFHEKLEQLGAVIKDPERGYVVTKSGQWIRDNAHTVVRAYVHGGPNVEPPFVRAVQGRSTTTTAIGAGGTVDAAEERTGIPGYRYSANTTPDDGEVINVMTGQPQT
jgi:hypothetical protein